MRTALASALVIVAGNWTLVQAQTGTPPDSSRRDSLGRFTLAPINVTVTRSTSELSRLPYAVQVIPGSEMGQGKARLGLDEALVGVPGVIAANRQNYALDQNISIRGFGARSAFGVRGLKILLDGIPQTLPDGQGQLTNVDMDDVERMEVLRGSSSSMYGNASGGVISLSTDEEVSRIAASVRVLGGDFGLMKYHGGFAAPIGRGSLALSGARTQIDGFRRHSTADLRQGRARLSLPLGQGTLSVVGQYANDPVIKDPGALTLTEMNNDPTLANPLSETRDAGKDVSQGQGGVTYTRLFGRLNASFTGFGLKRNLYNPTTAAYIELHRWAYGARGSAGMPVIIGTRTLMLNAGIDAQWQHDDRINMNFARTALTRDQLERVTEVGPFVQASIDPFRSVTVTVGARYDWNHFSVEDNFLSDGNDSGIRDMSSPSGTLGLVVHARDAIMPYANIGTSFETPTTTELANRPTGPGGFNPDLQPQDAVNYEIGVRGALPTGPSGRFDYSAAFYRANVTGELIPFEVPGDPGRRFYRNAGSSRHQGIEVGAGFHYAWLSLRAGWTHSDNKFLDYRVTTGTTTTVYDGKEEPGVPHNYFKAIATVRAGRFAWISVEQAAASSYFVNDANTTTNQNWLATAVRAGVDIPVAGWVISPFGSVDNLFDEHYAASVQVNAANGRFFEPSPWRNGYLGVEVRPK